jgi:phosphatidylserine/phosphatidylglycerophosphate/cardiolipin synthase-like enzyme
VHAKRGVIDGETTLLGTYNLDPRSANINSELMLMCRGQKELAAEVLRASSRAKPRPAESSSAAHSSSVRPSSEILR